MVSGSYTSRGTTCRADHAGRMMQVTHISMRQRYEEEELNPSDGILPLP